MKKKDRQPQTMWMQTLKLNQRVVQTKDSTKLTLLLSKTGQWIGNEDRDSQLDTAWTLTRKLERKLFGSVLSFLKPIINFFDSYISGDFQLVLSQ